MDFQFLCVSFLFSSLVFVFMVRCMYRTTKPNASNLPPGPKKLPVIGNMHQLAGSLPHRRLSELAKKHGSIMHLKLGEVTNIVISSPEFAKQVMKTHDSKFAQRPKIMAATIMTYNFTNIAFAPYGEYWRQMRKICILELLSAKRVQSFRSIREEEVSNLVSAIYSVSGLPFNFSRKLFSLTYTIAARASFGKKCKDQEKFVHVAEKIIEAAGGFSLSDLFPSVKFLQVISGMRSRLLKLSREADKILTAIIDDHSVSKDEMKSEEDDLVDVLLKLQDHGNLQFPLTTDNIKAVILDIFTAGSETSSTTVEWAISEMLKDPKVMEKAQEEVRSVFDKREKVDETGLQELTYLKLVIKETLRLHPAAPLLLPRECHEDCEINGYTIPANSKIIVNAWAIGRDPKYWSEPQKFNPDRFIDSLVDFRGAHFELIPFGAGRRICPGIAFGIANVELPLASLLYHFNWKLPGDQNPDTLDMSESFGATVRRKNDLQLIATPYCPALN